MPMREPATIGQIERRGEYAYIAGTEWMAAAAATLADYRDRDELLTDGLTWQDVAAAVIYCQGWSDGYHSGKAEAARRRRSRKVRKARKLLALLDSAREEQP